MDIFSKEYYDHVWELAVKMVKAGNEGRYDQEDKLSEELDNFQQDSMLEFYDNYNADTKEKEVVKDLIFDAIYSSETGQALAEVPEELDIDDVEAVIWEEIGDLLLDCFVDEDEDGKYADVMFGGCYVPHWDGWYEE